MEVIAQNDNKTEQIPSNVENIEKPLNDNWNIWFTPRGLSSEDYSKHLTLLGSVKTLKEFINYYCFLKRPSDIQDDNKIMVFREYCKPLWENYPQGGTWIIVFGKKDYQSLNQAWESLVFGLICEEFEDYNLIGITLSIRKKFNILEIWLKNREETKKMSTGEKIAQYLNIDCAHLKFQFKDHQSSLKDHSLILGSEQYQFQFTPMQETPLNIAKELPPEDIEELNEFNLDQ